MCDLDIYIDVEWTKSRMWGLNPTVTVTCQAETVRDGAAWMLRCDESKGHAAGCGSDKESAAVAQALNMNPVMQSLMLWRGFTPFDNRRVEATTPRGSVGRRKPKDSASP